MSQWPIVKLSELLRLDVDSVLIEPAATYPMLGVYSFGRGLFDRELLNGTNTSYKRLFRLASHHVVMSQLFGWEGALALAEPQFVGKFLSPQFPTFSCDQELIDRRYLGWQMRSPTFWRDLAARSTGMGDRRRTVNPESLLSLSIPLPPLLEQRRLVAKLDALAAKIDESRCASLAGTTSVLALRSAMFRRVLHDHASQGPVVRLGDICEFITDGTHQTPTYTDEGMPFLSAQNVKPYRFMPENHRKVSLEDFANYTRNVKPTRGDILLTRVGACIGEAAIVDREFEFAIYVSLGLIRPIPNRVDVRYLVHWLNSPDGAAKSRENTLGRGHSQGNLNLNLIRQFEFPLPPLERQERIAEILDSVQAKIDSLTNVRASAMIDIELAMPTAIKQVFNSGSE